MLSRISFALIISAFLVIGCSPSKTALTQDNEVVFTPSVVTPSVSVLAGTPVPFSDNSISAENAEQVTELARWGKGILNNITISPDGKLLAAASSIGIYLYDTTTLQEIRFIDTDTWVSTAVISPDSQLLATFYEHDDIFQLWNISDGSLLYTFEKHTDSVTSVDFSSDGQLLASGSRDHTIQVWQVSDGTYIRSLDGHTDDVVSVRFSPDGKTLATASGDNTIRIWNISDGALLHTLEGGHIYSAELVFSSDGQLLITHRKGQIVETQLWNVTNGSLVANLEGLHPVFSGDGQQISTISCTHTQTMECLILLWNRNGQPIKQITSDQPLYSTAFSPDGQYIAAGSMEDIFLFKISDGMLIKTFAPLDIPGGFSDDVNFLSFSNDGQTLISKSGNDSIRQWRISDGLLLKHERFDRMYPVAISQDGNLMAAATGDLVQIWNTSNGTLVGILKGHTWEISSLMFSPDNQTLIAAGGGGKTHLWRISDGALLQTVEIDGIADLKTISPDMQMLAATYSAGDISLWDASDGRLVYSLTGHTEFVTDIKFSIDKKTLVSASNDNAVKVWDLSNGTLINTINIQGKGSNYKTDISPDGKMVAIVGRGFVPVQLWNTVDGALLRTIEDYGVSIAFSPNGKLLTLIGSDEILKIYNISDMTLLHEVETEYINHLEHTPYTVFFPNGRALAIVSASGVVRVLGVPSENPLAVQPVNIPTMPSTPMAQSEASLTPSSTQSTLPSPTVFPATTASAPTQINCSNFISQLQPTMEGTVVTSGINMRNEPATNKTIVGVIYAGEKVTIYDEQPICNEGFLWWKVKAINSGITGWVAEGTTEERWLSP